MGDEDTTKCRILFVKDENGEQGRVASAKKPKTAPAMPDQLAVATAEAEAPTPQRQLAPGIWSILMFAAAVAALWWAASWRHAQRLSDLTTNFPEQPAANDTLPLLAGPTDSQASVPISSQNGTAVPMADEGADAEGEEAPLDIEAVVALAEARWRESRPPPPAGLHVEIAPVPRAASLAGGCGFELGVDLRGVGRLHPLHSRLCISAFTTPGTQEITERTRRQLGKEASAPVQPVFLQKCVSVAETQAWLRAAVDLTPWTDLRPTVSIAGLDDGMYTATAAVMDSRGRKHAQRVMFLAANCPAVHKEAAEGGALASEGAKLEVRWPGQGAAQAEQSQ